MFLALLVCLVGLTGESFAFGLGLQPFCSHRHRLYNRVVSYSLPPLFAALNGTSASYEYARDTESRLRNDQEKSYITLQRSIDGLVEYVKELKTELKTEIKTEIKELKTEIKELKTEINGVKAELKTEIKELDKKFMKAASGVFLALITVGLSSQPDLREWALSIFAAFK